MPKFDSTQFNLLTTFNRLKKFISYDTSLLLENSPLKSIYKYNLNFVNYSNNKYVYTKKPYKLLKKNKLDLNSKNKFIYYNQLSYNNSFNLDKNNYNQHKDLDFLSSNKYLKISDCKNSVIKTYFYLQNINLLGVKSYFELFILNNYKYDSNIRLNMFNFN